MNYLFTIYAIVSLAIVSFLAARAVKLYLKDKLTRQLAWFFSIGCGYIILLVISALWASGNLEYISRDLSIIYSLILIFQTAALLIISGNATGKKRISYFLALYAMAAIFFVVSLDYFSYFALIISLALNLLLAFGFIFAYKDYRWEGYLLAIYASVSLILILLLGGHNILISSLVSMALFLVFIYYFARKIESHVFVKHADEGEENYIFTFIRYFVFIIVITCIMLVSTIAVHELGHVAAAKYYGCEFTTVLFVEDKYPHTEVICSDEGAIFWTSLFGVILPILIALILFIIGGSFIRDISLLMLGFNFVAAYRDLHNTGMSGSLIISILVLGLIIIALSVILLARSRVEGSIFLDERKSDGEISA